MSDMFNSSSQLDADFWLRAAQAAVRRYCGWHVAPSVEETRRVNARGGRTLLLPTKRLTDLKLVKVAGVAIDLDQVDWGEEGTVVRRDGYWPDAPRSVQVTITHGWPVDEVPDILGLLASIARRASSNPAGVSSQSVVGMSVSYATSGGAPVALLGAETQLLDVYRIAQ